MGGARFRECNFLATVKVGSPGLGFCQVTEGRKYQGTKGESDNKLIR